MAARGPLHGQLLSNEGLEALKVWNMIIRPPRALYDVKAFGPSSFHLAGVHVTRDDIQIRTSRGLKLECSHYRPAARPGGVCEPTPVVIYLHGNASSRLEALHVIRPLLVRRIAVFCYDSAGCGLSEGDYVSLGWYERDDLATVIEHLRRSPLCSAVGVWGRSMGAATALLHCDRDSKIDAICADSAFASLPDLMLDIAQGEIGASNLPPWLLSTLMSVVKMRVKTLAGFDTDDVVPVDHVRNCHLPALYIHSKKDRFIPIEHTQRLFAEHAGDKEILELAHGYHNSRRGRMVVDHIVGFFERSFRRRPAPNKHFNRLGRPRTLEPPARLPFADLTNVSEQLAGADPDAEGKQTPRTLLKLQFPSHTEPLMQRQKARPALMEDDFVWEEVASSSPSGDRTPQSAPTTPPPLLLAPNGVPDGEVGTPPAVEMSSAFGYGRLCSDMRRSPRKRTKRPRQVHVKEDIEVTRGVIEDMVLLENGVHEAPSEDALERAVGVALDQLRVDPSLAEMLSPEGTKLLPLSFSPCRSCEPDNMELKACCSNMLASSVFGGCLDAAADTVPRCQHGKHWRIIAI